MVELTSADDLAQTPVWTLRHGGHAAPRKKRSQKMMQSIWRDAGGTSRRLLGIGRLAAIALPFVSSAKTPLTGQVTTGREFVTARVSMERVDRIRKRKRTRSTLNHVALTCLDGALRRYLSDQGVELRQPIIMQMPVKLRRDGEKTAGNKLGIILGELSPPTDGFCVRLRNIGFSLRNVRTMTGNVAPEAIESCTIITGMEDSPLMRTRRKACCGILINPSAGAAFKP